MKPTCAYHGSPHIDAILAGGLLAEAASGSCSHIWLARRVEDAAEYGPVIEVDVSGFGPWPTDGGDWQACYHGGDIRADRLTRLLSGATGIRFARPLPCRSSSFPLSPLW